MGQLPWDIVWRFLRKLNTDLSCDPAVPPLERHPMLPLGSYSKNLIKKRKNPPDICT